MMDFVMSVIRGGRHKIQKATHIESTFGLTVEAIVVPRTSQSSIHAEGFYFVIIVGRGQRRLSE